MAGYVIFGALAAFGALCALWLLFGCLLPDGREALVIAAGTPGQSEFSPARRYLWLKGLGLMKSPLVMVDMGLTEPKKRWLGDRGIEICSFEELPQRLGIGAEST